MSTTVQRTSITIHEVSLPAESCQLVHSYGGGADVVQNGPDAGDIGIDRDRFLERGHGAVRARPR